MSKYLRKNNEMDVHSDDVHLMKNERYTEIIVSNRNNNYYSTNPNKSKSKFEPDYQSEMCKFDSSRIYSEKPYLTNFRC